MDKLIAVYHQNGYYPDQEDYFKPSTKYPEYPYNEKLSVKKNKVYDMVRECLKLYGLDIEHYGTKDWNPLNGIVKQGDIVVLKPNMVMDVNDSSDGVDCLYTHPSVIAPIIDYVFLALKGRGSIIVGDAPMQECNFEKLIIESGYKNLIDHYKALFEKTKVTIELNDFRGYTSKVKNGVHYGNSNKKNDNGIIVNLSNESEFSGYSSEKLNCLRINSYNPEILKQHHNENKHEYMIEKSVLKADVIINVSKPKTHRKAGVTVALKNLVGINVRKEYLPHHCNGSSFVGGDEYNKKSFLKKFKSNIQDKINCEEDKRHYIKVKCLIMLRKCLTAFIRLTPDQSWDGSWYGNETISKTITDLNKILLYCDKDGNMQNVKQRNIFIVADMVISGENEGPVAPTKKEVGIIAVGEDPVCFDEVITTLMGFDVKKIPTIRQVRMQKGKYTITGKYDKALIRSNNIKWNNKHIEEIDKMDTLHFVPAAGWVGHIEA